MASRVCRILLLSTINNTLSLREAVGMVRREYGDIVRVQKVYFDDYEKGDVSLEPLERAISGSDIILVDVRGETRVGRELPRMLAGSKNKTIVTLIGGSSHIFALTRMGRFDGSRVFTPEREKEFDIHSYMKARKFSAIVRRLGAIVPVGMLKDMRNWVLAQEYYTEGDAENLKNLILFLLKHYACVKQIGKVPAPVRRPAIGLYVPGEGVCENLDVYKHRIGFSSHKPTVGVLLYGGMHFDDTRPVAEALYAELKEDVNLIFAFSKVEHNIEAVNKYLKDVDLFVNMQYFRLHGGPYGGEPEPTYEFLSKLNAPYIVPVRTYETDRKKWEEEPAGMSPLEIVLNMTLPEIDGAIEPVFVACLESEDDELLGKVKKVKVLEDGVRALAARIKRWLHLRFASNSEKRIAVITYDYPPGEYSIGEAGYLDVFKSLRVFLEKLGEEGYKVDLPDRPLEELFLAEGIVNSPAYVRKSRLRVPLDKYLQWFRALPVKVQKEVVSHWGPPPGDIMVDGTDILIPGVVLGNIFLGVQPARGVHEDPEKAYHDRELPPHHQYLAYYMFLEREFRADAIIHFGMHGTLEFTKGKEAALSRECYPALLIGSMPHIYYYWIGNTSESTIAKRRSLALCVSHASPPMRCAGLYGEYLVLENLLNEYDTTRDEKVLQEIKDVVNHLHMEPDVETLRKRLFKMKRTLITRGLHIMDRKPSSEDLEEFLLAVLRIDRDVPSLFRFLAERKGTEWGKIKNTHAEHELENTARKVITAVLNGRAPEWLPKDYVAFINQVAAATRDFCESRALLDALCGRFVMPARGGDPVRDPEVYPAGRAMYAFDPRLVPTVTAEARGRQAAEMLLNAYRKREGRWPETVGVVLWGFETMKTGGDTIAMILALLGVRLIHKKSPWFKELEVIPLEKLGRPRIDVAVTICGIFRDTFHTHVDLINRAVEIVAFLDEPPEMNFVKKHYFQAKEKLGDFALARVFGPSPSEYATSMRTLVETGCWKSEDELARSYEESMNHAYFRGRVEKQNEAFNMVLTNVDVVTQERDNVEYDITDLDHYYEFLGGLAKAVEVRKSERADVMVIDTTEDVEVLTLSEAIDRAARTRIFNPLWIEGLLEHDFHGAKKIKDRMEYLLGFAATTGHVKEWIFDEVAETFVFNEDVRKRLQANNIYAAIRLVELLVEAQHRGYWSASPERVEALQEILLKMESTAE